MSLLNPENPDIAFARDCVITTLMDIPDSYGAIVIVSDEQAYLAAMVQRNHDRQRTDAIQRAAQRLVKRSKRPAHRAVVVDLDGKRVA